MTLHESGALDDMECLQDPEKTLLIVHALEEDTIDEPVLSESSQVDRKIDYLRAGLLFLIPAVSHLRRTETPRDTGSRLSWAVCCLAMISVRRQVP